MQTGKRNRERNGNGTESGMEMENILPINRLNREKN